MISHLVHLHESLHVYCVSDVTHDVRLMYGANDGLKVQKNSGVNDGFVAVK
jgi:hypothetical protein